jgi:hypothetical protein
MKFFKLVLVLISILTIYLLPFKAKSQDEDGYTTSTTIIEKSNLVGDNETDTGNFIILKYKRSFDIPGVIDEEHERNIFKKLTTFDDLLLNHSYSLPDTSIFISTFFWSPWSYCIPKLF